MKISFGLPLAAFSFLLSGCASTSVSNMNNWVIDSQDDWQAASMQHAGLTLT